MRASDYLRILRRNWMIIVALAVLGASAGAWFSSNQKPLYQSTASVFVTTQSATTVSELNQGSTYTQQLVQSYADVVRKSIVLEPVIDELGLDMTPGALASKITANAPLNTVLLEISATNGSPETAAAIANAVTTSLVTVVPELSPAGKDSVPPVKVTLLQPAVPSSTPVAPRTSLNILLGLLAGLALALGTAVARTVADTRIRSIEDVEGLTDLPILGGIAFDKDAKKRPLIVQWDPRGPRAESFRSLRANLRFLDGGRGVRSVVVTSSIENEGKTTSSANLAIAVADAGLSTVIVEADLRKPRLAKTLGLEGSVGLTNVLIGAADLDDVLQPWGDGKLVVLASGPIPPNPSELLQSDNMAEVVEELTSRFDMVIFDAPPLLPVSDAAVLARLTSGAIVVAAAMKTHRRMLKSALSVLAAVEARTLGVVLTMLPTRGPDSDNFNRYGYSYRYSDEPKPARSPLRWPRRRSADALPLAPASLPRESAEGAISAG
ncbi:polysaccharide biosynthesis tyrosine autokinase [Naasia sp. SYSU D00948]|uniref:polysaccharide biosynthesis tyrosine autokinase n=1 Tax=Naasia sp. SYSU D00948 TaxID=2817379 RepID=UPI001B3159E3|nr:polysaccharide biosynthesis tyrosine autokinase [Naasia sp. SYSU D00948]